MDSLLSWLRRPHALAYKFRLRATGDDMMFINARGVFTTQSATLIPSVSSDVAAGIKKLVLSRQIPLLFADGYDAWLYDLSAATYSTCQQDFKRRDPAFEIEEWAGAVPDELDELDELDDLLAAASVSLGAGPDAKIKQLVDQAAAARKKGAPAASASPSAPSASSSAPSAPGASSSAPARLNK